MSINGNSRIGSLSFGILLRVVMIFFLSIFLVPILFSISTSLKTQADFYRNIWGFPKILVFSNYVQAFVIGKIGVYFFNSVIISLFALLIIQICCLLLAYALARLHIPFANLILFFLLIIQILPTESQIVPLYIIFSKAGLFKIRYWGIILAYVGWSVPGTSIIMVNFFKTIPAELMESARIDGSGELRTLVQIVIPLMKSVMATCFIFNFNYVWGEMMWAQIATAVTDKGIPLTIGLLNFRGTYSTNWPMLTSAICMVMIPLFAAFLFTQKYFIAGLTAGSVKG